MRFSHKPLLSNTLAITHRSSNGSEPHPNLRIYYELHGNPNSPRKLLLIGGLSNNCRVWNLTLHHLLDDDLHICIFDNRTTGHSSKDPKEVGSFDVKDLAGDVIELLGELGWSGENGQELYLIGFSMGGMIAQQVVFLQPAAKFKAVGLIATTAIGLTAFAPPVSTLVAYAKVAVGITKTNTHTQERNFILPLIFQEDWLNSKPTWTDKYETNRDFIDECYDMRDANYPKQNDHGRNAQIIAVAKHAMTNSQLKQLSTKTRFSVFVGMHDKMIPAKHGLNLAKQLGVEPYIFERAGHALMEQEHDLFHSILLKDFLGNANSACEPDFKIQLDTRVPSVTEGATEAFE